MAAPALSHRFNIQQWLNNSEDFRSLVTRKPAATCEDVIRRFGLLSASSWNENHFAALKIHTEVDVDDELVVPNAYYPTEEGKIISGRGFHISDNNATNILADDFRIAKSVPAQFATFFQDLINVLNAGSAEMLPTSAAEPKIDILSTSGSFTSSTATDKQDKDEKSPQPF
ncbi:hypothetical protein HK097_000367 [Rhizophlyctis rosea]|uniref:Uncharacterized protein n=1 Tax=Rhizophlyctis rosea TaxID=64517 RepID=A0AAD5S5Q0_9FUNG|nr:hypothetical protein HK097_000367 [Rhizophlyctis rosea]